MQAKSDFGTSYILYHRGSCFFSFKRVTALCYVCASLACCAFCYTMSLYGDIFYSNYFRAYIICCLTQLAKVLQNLSNGLLFGDKEEFMMQCNVFIESNRARIAAYFERLIQVDDLEDALAVYTHIFKHTLVNTTTQTLSFILHVILFMYV